MITLMRIFNRSFNNMKIFLKGIVKIDTREFRDLNYSETKTIKNGMGELC